MIKWKEKKEIVFIILPFSLTAKLHEVELKDNFKHSAGLSVLNESGTLYIPL